MNQPMKNSAQINQPSSQIQILSKRMVVPLFMFGGFAGGLSLILASVFIPGVFGDGSVLYMLIFGVFGTVLVALGLRPRVLSLHTQTKEVQIAWGMRRPWVVKTYPPNEWKTITVEKIFPVAVYPHHVSNLPPVWRVFGHTKREKKVFLAEYPSEQEGQHGKEFFMQQFQLRN